MYLLHHEEHPTGFSFTFDAPKGVEVVEFTRFGCVCSCCENIPQNCSHKHFVASKIFCDSSMSKKMKRANGDLDIFAHACNIRQLYRDAFFIEDLEESSESESEPEGEGKYEDRPVKRPRSPSPSNYKCVVCFKKFHDQYDVEVCCSGHQIHAECARVVERHLGLKKHMFCPMCDAKKNIP